MILSINKILYFTLTSRLVTKVPLDLYFYLIEDTCALIEKSFIFALLVIAFSRITVLTENLFY